MRWIRILLAVNAVALLAVSFWLRGHELASLPGINGDEAWYGIQAGQMLRGEKYLLRTPSALPVNPLFFGPVVLVHCFGAPSILLLRSVAVACGLATLAVNYCFARWLWDRRAAVCSTLVLAVLPVNIAYSRLAWDSCLSVATTLPVLYLVLASVRQPARGSTLLTAAAALLAVAGLVHPTNLFIGLALVPAAFVVRRDLVAAWQSTWARLKSRPLAPVCGALVLLVLTAAAIGYTAQQPRVRKMMGQRLEHVARWTQPEHLARSLRLALVRYPRLFVGGSVYRFMAGSGSALEWPTAVEDEQPGIDVLLFWALLLAAGWRVWRSTDGCRTEDRVLLAAWALQLAAFLAVGGVDGLKHHHERYALSLVAPVLAIVTRAAMLLAAQRPRAAVALGLGASIAGWLLLADFQRSMFDFIHRTGGTSHLAFNTAQRDPKQAALEYALTQREPSQPVWILASEWWTYCPLRYLALGQPDVHVAISGDSDTDPGFQASAAAGRVWLVELSAAEDPRYSLPPRFKVLAHRCFRDYAGRPVVHAYRVSAAAQH
jgi:4-amino-4-deoxy-L-arabinose transferase-like glycosyltransferase